MKKHLLIIFIVVLGTMITRFLPFIVFPAKKVPPPFIKYLGNVLPNAVMGLLVIYSLKDSFSEMNHLMPAVIALIAIFLLHKWKRNTLLSISVGTLLYMFLIQHYFI